MKPTFSVNAITRRNALLAGASSALNLTLPRHLQAQSTVKQHWGINLAGADFGKLLGQHGRDYLYPTSENFAYYAALGFTLVRLPFKWERLQPELNQPFNSHELSRLKAAVKIGLEHGLIVVLDVHNYAKRRLSFDGWTKEHLIGSARVPRQSFADLWAELASHFSGQEGVQFGLMNEPDGLDARTWLEIANATIAAIRSRGATNLIHVPGTAYTGAHSWLQVGNEVMADVVDPARNFAIEVHQYLDHDSSGTHSDVVSSSIGSERLVGFQSWARKHQVRAFLGEYGAAKDELSCRALADMLDEIAANSDVWMGSAAWAGGPRWPPEERFNLEPPSTGETKPQVTLIASRAKGQPIEPACNGLQPIFAVDIARQTAAPQLDVFAAFLAQPQFTLVVELTNGHLARDFHVLTLNNEPILSLKHGALSSSWLKGALATSGPQPLALTRVRCAISIDRKADEGRLMFTGGLRAAARLSTPAFVRSDEAGLLKIAASAVTRLRGYGGAFSAQELAVAVA